MMRLCNIVRLWDAIQFEAGRVIAAVSYLAGNCKYLQVHREVARDGLVAQPFGEEESIHIAGCVKILTDAATEFGLGASVSAGKRAFAICLDTFRGSHSYDRNQLTKLIEAISHLLGVFRDDMEARKTLILPASSAERWSKPEAVFGERVLDAFPSIGYDAREAGRCIALDRTTAAVFHCMRIMEVGLEALSKDLGLDVATNWNNAQPNREGDSRAQQHNSRPNLARR